MSGGSVRRGAAAILLGVTMLAAFAPSALAKPSSTFTVTACADSSSIYITAVWDGIAADGIGFGAGDRTGNGLGDAHGFDGDATLTSGDVTESFPFPLDGSYWAAGATLYLGGFEAANIVATKTLHRGHWPSC